MDQMLAELINATIVERTTQLWAKNWNKDLRPCSPCTSHALTTERSLLHRDCMERDTKWFYKWLFHSKSFSHLIFILTFKSWVIPFPNVLPQRSFNVDLYRFSEKIKIIGSVKIKKVFKKKNKKHSDRMTLSFLAILREPHIFSFFWSEQCHVKPSMI